MKHEGGKRENEIQNEKSTRKVTDAINEVVNTEKLRSAYGLCSGIHGARSSKPKELDDLHLKWEFL
jgi:hypothetical protein